MRLTHKFCRNIKNERNNSLKRTLIFWNRFRLWEILLENLKQKLMGIEEILLLLHKIMSH